MAISITQIYNFSVLLFRLTSFPTFCIYLLMVGLAGVWQKSTKPLTLRPILIIYNVVCSGLSVVTGIGFVTGIWLNHHLYDKTDSAVLKPYFLLYWLTKNVELLDTVFMVLRHRRRQISFLHIYHHASMLLLSDLAYHNYPWPAIAVILALNSCVHVVLYSYYALSAYWPNHTLPWKQRLTEIQIIQFLIDFVYGGIGYAYHGFCVYGLLYGLGMTSLFSNFYYHAYLAPKSKKNKKASD